MIVELYLAFGLVGIGLMVAGHLVNNMFYKALLTFLAVPFLLFGAYYAFDIETESCYVQINQTEVTNNITTYTNWHNCETAKHRYEPLGMLFGLLVLVNGIAGFGYMAFTAASDTPF